MKKYGVVSPEQVDKGAAAGDETKEVLVGGKKPADKKKEKEERK